MNWIQRTKIVGVVAVACALPGVLPADEDPSGSSGESARFASVTEAVSANPETAEEIVGSLSRSFPESAPLIVASAIEGLPEATDEAVRAIVEAAVQAAPEQEAAIEAAVAELQAPGGTVGAAAEEGDGMTVEAEASEDAASEEATADAEGQAGSGDETGAAAEPEAGPDAVSEEAAGSGENDAAAERETTPAAEAGDGGSAESAGDEEPAAAEEAVAVDRPERLEREVELVESLIGSLPGRATSIARRSVGRVADEESFWTAAIVDAAIAAAPEYADDIVSEAIAEAPQHEAAIRKAAEAESSEESSAPDANADTGLPDRLESEIEMAESLIRAFPDRTPATVRRSVGRVADEEAFWTGALVKAAIAAAPDHEEEIVSEAIVAAPHHEDAIREAAGRDVPEDESLAEEEPAEGDESEPAEVAEDGDEEEKAIFSDPFVLAGASESVTLEGDRLSVRFELPISESSRVRLAVESLELRIQPELYFDSYKGRYRQRDMAVITGDGIVGLVFKLNPDDAVQLRETANVLARFQETAANVDAFITAKRADEGTGLLLGSVREEIGTVYQYPSRDKVPAEFVGDFDDRTYQLAVGGSIRLTPDTVPAVRHMVEHLPRYEREYRDLLRKRDGQLEEFQELTRTQPSETPVEEKDES